MDESFPLLIVHGKGHKNPDIFRELKETEFHLFHFTIVSSLDPVLNQKGQRERLIPGV